MPSRCRTHSPCKQNLHPAPDHHWSSICSSSTAINTGIENRTICEPKNFSRLHSRFPLALRSSERFSSLEQPAYNAVALAVSHGHNLMYGFRTKRDQEPRFAIERKAEGLPPWIID